MWYLDPLNKLEHLVRTWYWSAPQEGQAITNLCRSIRSEGITLEKLKDLHILSKSILTRVPIQYKDFCAAVMSHLVYLMLNALEDYESKEELSMFLLAVDSLCELAQMYMVAGNSLRAWDFILRSINPSYAKKEKEEKMEWLTDIWEKALQAGVPNARKSVVRIIGTFFQVSGVLGHNFEECTGIYQATKQWLQLGESAEREDIYYIYFFARILENAWKSDIGTEVVHKLKEQYPIEEVRSDQMAVFIASALDHLTPLLGESNQVWKTKALALRVSNELNQETKTSLTITALVSEEVLNKDQISQTLFDFLSYLTKSVPDPMTACPLRQRFSDIANRIVMEALSRDEYEFAVEIAYMWRTYRGEGSVTLPSEENILLVLSNVMDHRVIYILKSGGTYRKFEFDRKISSKQFMQVKSEFEGSWSVAMGELSPSVEEKDHPQYDMSGSYYKQLMEYYSIEKIAEILDSAPAEMVFRILEIPWMNSPLESLLGRHTSQKLSTLVTDRPKQATPISKILIWCEPSMAFGHLQNEDMQKVISNYKQLNGDVEVDVYDQDALCTRGNFLKLYSSDKYDLIWLICHGEFKVGDPANSTLKVAQQEPVTLKMLHSRIPVREKRRLLVLDACKSGCSSVRYNGMGFVGFGQTLANHNQSIIGHLWMADFYASPVLGILLMAHLLENRHWAESLNNARKIFYEGGQSLQGYFQNMALDSDLVKSALNKQEEWKKMIYWASPALFQ